MNEQKNISIRNKRATYDYEILDTYVAGIVLSGTEIKSLRLGKASLTDCYCYFHNGELFVRGMNIANTTGAATTTMLPSATASCYCSARSSKSSGARCRTRG